MNTDGYKQRLKPDALPTMLSHKVSKHSQTMSENRLKKQE